MDLQNNLLRKLEEEIRGTSSYEQPTSPQLERPTMNDLTGKEWISPPFPSHTAAMGPPLDGGSDSSPLYKGDCRGKIEQMIQEKGIEGPARAHIVALACTTKPCPHMVHMCTLDTQEMARMVIKSPDAHILRWTARLWSRDSCGTPVGKKGERKKCVLEEVIQRSGTIGSSHWGGGS